MLTRLVLKNLTVFTYGDFNSSLGCPLEMTCQRSIRDDTTGTEPAALFQRTGPTSFLRRGVADIVDVARFRALPMRFLNAGEAAGNPRCLTT
jgi:hypothetical protein